MALAALGYDPGPADNVLGPQTRKALLQYQKDNELPQGNLNKETLKALRLVDVDGDGHPCDESEEQPPQRDGAMVERKPGLRKPGERGREVAGPVGEALRRIRRAPLAADRAA
jgi:peptidoglycan hydrolase-like protein with peptidoglycan-binding domain